MKYLTNISWILLEEADILPHYFLAKISSSVPANAKCGTLFDSRWSSHNQSFLSNAVLLSNISVKWFTPHMLIFNSFMCWVTSVKIKSHIQTWLRSSLKVFLCVARNNSSSDLQIMHIFRPKLNHPTSAWYSICHSPASFSTGMSRLCSTLLVSSRKFTPAVIPC